MKIVQKPREDALLINPDQMLMELAKVIADPISYQIPLKFPLAEMAELETLEPGEDLWCPSAVDTDQDTILALNTTTGALSVNKRSPVGFGALTLSDLTSEIEYVLISAMLGAKDKNKFARVQAALARAMDKKEAKVLFDAILAQTGTYVPGVNVQSIAVASGADIFDHITDMVQAISDYGDNYVLLAGTAAYNAIVTYDKTKIATNLYKADMQRLLDQLKVKLVKVSANATISAIAGGGSAASILNTNKVIMVARESEMENRKPITIVRKKFNADIVDPAGVEVTPGQQRAYMKAMAPVNNAGTNTFAYGVQVYEQIGFFITNPYAIGFSDLSTLV